MTGDSEPILKLSGVRKAYRHRGMFGTASVPALNGVTLELGRGEVAGLLGLNGAGKTTIMKLITGLLFPDSGSVSVFGRSPLDMEAKRRIGYLPELPYFYPGATAAESLSYYGALSGERGSELRGRVARVVEKVGLLPHSRKKASAFSKGMMQRLGVAQAIIHEPDLLVLDEPVSGLDPLAIHEIRELISEFNAAGRTVFLSSHSISELEKLSDRVFIMVRGALARTVTRAEWSSAPGGLEAIFVAEVRAQEPA